jgi:hypothetical protein
MSSSFSQLGAAFSRLGSVERRFIVIVAVVVFVAINLVFVFPHFSDLGQIKNRFGDARAKLDRYEKAIAQSAFYRTNIVILEGEGASVPQEDQSVNFLQAIQNQAAQSQVSIISNNRQPESTNQFFLERAQALTTQSGEQQLVDFLYNLGAGSSLIRVRALSVRPDAPRTGLSANIRLIASYQKKAPTRSTPAQKTTPAAKPATAAKTPPVKPTTPAGAPAVKPSTSKK